ncbi:unnamed protein product [Paramecium octaurelia]|uniref:EF-hand domain-containing protein n=1 Tax=Paramecium octaurelia TaxID=43137 RepID=A0A8S1RYH7_PAROT|nr:unnamed protein product [Paramecium octaurelia]
MDSKQNKQKAHKTKTMSNKEIYRILAFEFQQQDSLGIKIDLIAEMVSSLFYPNDQNGEAKQNFKNLITQSFKSHCYKDEINEESFCNAMNSVEKYINEETTDRFLQKIFKRHDSDKDGFLNQQEFVFLMKNYKDSHLTEADMLAIYNRMSQGDPKGVSYENFKKYSL